MHEYESSTGTNGVHFRKYFTAKAQVLENFINHQFNRFSSCAFRSRDTQQNAFDMIFYLFSSCFVYIHLITKLNQENKCQNIVEQSFRSFFFGYKLMMSFICILQIVYNLNTHHNVKHIEWPWTWLLSGSSLICHRSDLL